VTVNGVRVRWSFMPDTGQGPHFTPGTDKHGRLSRYRVVLPHAGIIETEKDHFEATEYAQRRRGWSGHLADAKDWLVGSSMSSRRLSEERLSKKVALAIFSSDALSSTAYATQEIVLVLVLAGTGAIKFSLPIAACIAGLLGLVVISYRQIIRAYPGGGGAYIVAHENLGAWAGLVAAASLLIDYVLTVAVSIAACVEAIVSANQSVHSIAVPLALALVVLIALGNLRGLRESGTLFSIPTYGFIFLLTTTIVVGMFKVIVGHGENVLAVGPASHPAQAEQAVTLFLILKAFSAGCTALTGVEAISNGVSAFKKPEPRNAASTMTSMALILGALFLGTTLLARHFGIVYTAGDKETVMSQIGEQVFGRNAVYYALQAFTAGILFLAANTSYNGFPMLAAILARDGYMPRFFHSRGNRLVFSYGIAALTGFAILLLAVFDAETTRLIPLYALGVFLSFTLAQTGMVKRWLTKREEGWKRSAVINAVGGTATGVVFVIILLTKFAEGGWMVALLVPVITIWLFRIGGFYKSLARTLDVPSDAVLDMRAHGESRVPIIVPVEGINLAAVMAIGSACERSRDVTAVHVIVDPDAPSAVAERWERQFPNVPLVIIDSPFRTVTDPLAAYIDDRLRTGAHELTVLVPVLEVRRPWLRPLVNQSLKRLQSNLQRRHAHIEYFAFDASAAGRRRSQPLPKPDSPDM
jgi:amino acid transporter